MGDGPMLQDLEIVERQVYEMAKAAAGKSVLQRLLTRAEAQCAKVDCGNELVHAQRMVSAALSEQISTPHLPAEVAMFFPGLDVAVSRYNGLIDDKSRAEGEVRKRIAKARELIFGVKQPERLAYEQNLREFETLLRIGVEGSVMDIGEFGVHPSSGSKKAQPAKLPEIV